MNRKDIETYWMPAREVFGPKWGFDESKALAEVLGIPYPEPEWCEQIELTDELRSKLMRLGGPYGKTFLKALEVVKHDEG